ncbi:uncharacterized protein F5891DRAFT_1173047 [Suillus fuscotomentosus]|uniref:Uncharacterized protein n=1 Tax=Suillus fuscotomentosus TaxID=1912939 RepID=A0AAD4E6J7_9AGAM|nr:uncharacterized protein F5891DRAFT_1173047 [Suillus fuscotomentosus]KAG1900594.1 hypothetical protein F5891DRAFT_1173047 [Suillus fuscotomentosus]
MTSMFSSDPRTLGIVTTIVPSRIAPYIDAPEQAPDYLAMLTAPGILLHQLDLKISCICAIRHNLSVKRDRFARNLKRSEVRTKSDVALAVRLVTISEMAVRTLQIITPHIVYDLRAIASWSGIYLLDHKYYFALKGGLVPLEFLSDKRLTQQHVDFMTKLIGYPPQRWHFTLVREKAAEDEGYVYWAINGRNAEREAVERIKASTTGASEIYAIQLGGIDDKSERSQSGAELKQPY